MELIFISTKRWFPKRAVTPDDSYAYVLASDSVAVINTNTNQIVKIISFSGTGTAQGIAVTPEHSRIFLKSSIKSII